MFVLTDGGPLDTRRFANGRYIVRATAEDFCGNVGTLSEPVWIENELGSADGPDRVHDRVGGRA